MLLNPFKYYASGHEISSKHKNSQQKKKNPQLLLNVPSKKQWHYPFDFDNIMCNVTKNNDIVKLQKNLILT